MSITIVIADDHKVVRTGLARILRDTEIEIVAEATNGQDAFNKAVEHRPDVVLLDVRMPIQDGITTLEQIRHALPETRVVMLSTHDNPSYIANAVDKGAADYLLKGCSREDLIGAIRAAVAGQPPTVQGETLRLVQSRSVRLDASDGTTLTLLESDMLRHVAKGLSDQDIARELNMDIHKIEQHVQNLLRKLGLADRSHASKWIMQNSMPSTGNDKRPDSLA